MEAIGRLAGGVAHDFNNLLTIISGYGRMVLDELGMRHKLRGRVEEVLNAADRAAILRSEALRTISTICSRSSAAMAAWCSTSWECVTNCAAALRKCSTQPTAPPFSDRRRCARFQQSAHDHQRLWPHGARRAGNASQTARPR